VPFKLSRRARVLATSLVLPLLLVVGVSGTASASGSRAPADVAVSHRAVETELTISAHRRFGPIGTQMCPHVTAFVVFFFLLKTGELVGWCYDGGDGTVTLPANLVGAQLVDVDNQIGSQLWLSGFLEGGDQAQFNWCYDSGYDFAVGGPDVGGTIEGWQAFPLVDEAILLSGSQCGGDPSTGTTEPALVPDAAPDCRQGYRGDHALLLLSVGTLMQWACYEDTPGSFATPLGYSLFAVDNGNPHALVIDGSGWSNCVSWNHALEPIEASEQDLTSITITSGGGTCPAS
jgi:hypothetical protein